MKTISIITPSYNSAEFIERTLASVRDQGYPNYEHTIVDGGSKDGTDRIAKKFPNTKFILAEKSTQSQALNVGFRAAKGEIIGWINSDDVYEAGAFRAAADYLEKHPEVGMVYSDCRFIDQYDKEVGVWRTSAFSHFRNLNYAQMIPQPTIFFRRSVFDTVGYLDESYFYAMDFDFLVRVSKKCRIERIPQVVLAGFRLQPNSKTVSQRKKFEPEVKRVRKEQGAVVPYFIVGALQKFISLFKKRL